IIPGDEFYLFRDDRKKSRSARKARSLSANQLQHEHEVMWMEQQVARRRVKRGYRRVRHTDDNEIVEDEEAQVSKSRNRKHPDPNDPLWTDMWGTANKVLRRVKRAPSHSLRLHALGVQNRDAEARDRTVNCACIWSDGIQRNQRETSATLSRRQRGRLVHSEWSEFSALFTDVTF
uniref:S8_pro-domain domain-containing protein n=1 Tax=Caenorhabditis japonica TaxID=281687 RepID=A0A8R1ICJ0_CAEJA